MYLDLIIIFNFIMNINIMYGVSIILRRIIKFKYIIISSILGIIPTLIYLVNNIVIINIVIVILFSFVMSIIAFGYKNIIYTTKNIIYMYVTSIFLGGSLYLFNVKFNSMILSLIFLVVISIVLVIIYTRLLLSLKNNNSLYYQVSIFYKGEIITCLGFLDTGNKIFDPYKGYPVILLSKNKLKQGIGKYILVPYKTVSSDSILKCFKPDIVYINGNPCKKKCLVALIDSSINVDCDLILHSKLLERI